ncbi:MAG TPA: sugar ABC transporter substrate-binding protein [Alphaproteobacteria bacterium]|nr:sugar ABC transporter substrate-binding protein [Alphaproteobacteria bacterium]
MRKLFLATAMGAVVLAGPAAAQSLQVVEVITSPQRTELLQGQIDAFEAANPDVSVELVSLPWDQAFEKFLTMVQAGQTPDVVEMPERWLSLYAGNGQLESLEPYLEEWEGADRLTERTLEFARAVDDTAYMVPYGFYIRAMFYNKKLFEEAGIDGPPETMEEFMDASRRITELGGGKSGYCMRGGRGGFNGWYMMMAAMNGKGAWFNEDGTSTFNEPGAVEGFQFLVDMYQQGYAPRDSVNWGFNEIVAGFYSGTCAMLDQDPDALIAIAERMPAEDFAVAPMPVGPSGKAYPTIGFAGWSMFADSENKELAGKLIGHLTSPEANLEWAKFVGVIPIHQGAQDDPHFSGEQYAGWFTELNDPRYELTPMPAHLEELGYFFDSLSIQTAQEALLGQRTAEDVTNEWAEYLTAAQQKWLAEQQ